MEAPYLRVYRLQRSKLLKELFNSKKAVYMTIDNYFDILEQGPIYLSQLLMDIDIYVTTVELEEILEEVTGYIDKFIDTEELSNLKVLNWHRDKSVSIGVN